MDATYLRPLSNGSQTRFFQRQSNAAVDPAARPAKAYEAKMQPRWGTNDSPPFARARLRPQRREFLVSRNLATREC
jgi:hypothetical protein